MWNRSFVRARRYARLAVAAGSLALASAGCEDGPARRRSPKPMVASTEPVGRPAPQPAPPPAAGATEGIDAQALFDRMRARGKRGTVVNVWASWCGSCRAEIPMLLALSRAFAADELDFVFVSADETADLPKAVELMRSWSAPLPVWFVEGPMTPFKRAMHPSWKGAIPATFLFDDQRELRHFWEGPILEHEISPILQGYLAGEPIDGETRPPLAGELE